MKGGSSCVLRYSCSGCLQAPFSTLAIRVPFWRNVCTWPGKGCSGEERTMRESKLGTALALKKSWTKKRVDKKDC